ncbi:MAG TPA: permease [Caldilineae bacterium]|nr:permease [Caldilineae bacterium]
MPEGFILVDPESQPESSPTPISFAAPTAQRAAWRVWALVLGAAVAWLLVWGRLQPFADWLTYEIIGLAPDSRLGESVAFFLYDVPKILMLLGGMIFLVTVVRSFFSAERTRQLLGGKREGVGNVLAAGLGVVTPFCSCSAVPLFIGFVETGIPLGVTFSFLIATPMVNEVALAMLFGLFGWQIAGLYMITGLAVAIVAGWFIGRIPDIEKGVEDFVWQIDVGEANIQASKPTWTERFEQAWRTTKEIVGKVWPYVVVGIAIGAAIHGYVPEDALADVLGADAWWSVPAGVLLGIPMYSNAAGIIPVVHALTEKGAALGTVLAFMMSVIALSLPEMIILRRVLKLRLIAIFIAVVASGILLVGFLFNAVI